MKKIIVSAIVALFLIAPVVSSTAAVVENPANCFSAFVFQYNLSIALGKSHEEAQEDGFQAFDSCAAGQNQ